MVFVDMCQKPRAIKVLLSTKWAGKGRAVRARSTVEKPHNTSQVQVEHTELFASIQWPGL